VCVCFFYATIGCRPEINDDGDGGDNDDDDEDDDVCDVM